MYSSDPAHVLQRELLRLRDHLERILETAANPECFACADARRLARLALEPPPPSSDDWQT